MTKDKLWESRCIPALNEMYAKADTVFDKSELPPDFEYTFENILKYAPAIEGDTRCEFPMYAFYLDEETLDEVIARATKRLRTWYAFPYRSEIIYDKEQIAQMKEQVAKLSEDPERNEFEISMIQEKIDANPRNKKRHNLWLKYQAEYEANSKALESKEIDRKEYNKRMKALYEKYGCRKRGDHEMVRFSIWNYAPNTHTEFFGFLKCMYGGGTPGCNEWTLKSLTHDLEVVRGFVENARNGIITTPGKL